MDVPLATHIARLVSTRCLALDLMPADVARHLSISRDDVIALLQGRYPLTFVQAIALARLLQVPLMTLADERLSATPLSDIHTLAAQLPVDTQQVLVPFLRALARHLAAWSLCLLWVYPCWG